MRHEWLDDAIQIAFHHGGQIIKRQFDAMVRDAILGEIVGTDTFIAFTGADLCLALGSVLRILLGNFPVEQTRAQNFHGLGLVLKLRTFVRATHHQAARPVQNLDRGVRSIYALAAGARRAANGNFQFLRLDFDVHFLRFRQDGNGTRAGMDAALGFGRWHALNAMDATLVFEPLEGRTDWNPWFRLSSRAPRHSE